MANNFAGNPWALDTVMPAPIFDWVWIQEIAWTDFGAVDALVIKDAAGRIILDTKNTTANEVYQKFGVQGRFHGFQLTTLTAGGKVFVYIR
jgi:hypothetical protein